MPLGADAEEQVEKQVESESADSIALTSTGDLDPQAANFITASALTHLVVVAGEVGSGKTTLLATMYEKFSRGPYAGFYFAGSRTLLGWERRCSLARVDSGLAIAETERTTNIDCKLLHLRLQPANLDLDPRDILFTDISGERFQLLCNSTDECKRFSELLRVDHFVLTVDGQSLIDVKKRHPAASNAGLILRSCLDAEMLSDRSFVDVLVTKKDLFAAQDGKTSEFIAAMRETLRGKFENRLARLRFFEIAARPASRDTPFAHGIDACFPSWVMEAKALRPRRQVTVGSQVQVREREFNSFRNRAG